ncbi:TetR/AcrR family transcriptional regulator [Mucilaginibacter rubeus]|uniref:TetR/AcrR family transcriptional regulator n=1 Tax=Mucilaginibacter rubeus TaxID=2027860 RepID=A0AAE6ML33_9SPHI|nr:MULTISPECIES: TetR/AcrR family transcriptional regulator [Mucilaginibacter]QEM06787.1 TetR/AcrR family transcriptional regulator [Mucilaginibacter rubeus]QEM19374.1 TetR/AcrR family transcriptional regulator [Mucilaginibacter gossypii]QTE44077.1 TetR/AcrR family transcriptional regulator [Mucilaginibacter rubeus]QTE50678.1 TetR/AcrR family transcriptional regulator [Mucilaginibacter rubeus]QTE55760.1 TetR/AcrR family transcriptional regulator [Mucilaginibacter rubeus]
MARSKDFDEAEVLSKAVCIFWHKGYNGTSMQDLVDGLGISRSSLYDTFGDKHALYIKALDSYQKAGGNQMCDIINNSASAKEAIQKLLELTMRDLLNDEQRKGCFMVNAEIELAPHDVEVKNVVCRNEQQFEDAILQAIKKGQASGEVRNSQDSLALARFIMNAVRGMQVSAKATADKAFFDDIIKTTLSVLD